jgi:hypothetical protein
MYAQLDKRFLILTHFGINNQNAFSGGVVGADGKKPQLYMHDAWVEYKVWDSYLDIGAGLHYWNGISRATSASTLNFLGLDAPIFNWATIEKTDQFARMLGIYGKGRIGQLEYRVAVNEPFKTSDALQENVAGYNPGNIDKVYQGYFSYNFLETESNKLPFYVGSYLGTKKVFNIGAGFLQNSNAMWSLQENGDTATHNQLLWAIDAFLDMPVGADNKHAITAYTAYFNYDFGPNNIRNIGIMNSADGGGSLRGNAVPLIGTGQILYGQFGYLFGKLKTGGRLQPFASYSHAFFEGVRNAEGDIVPVQIVDAGVNYYMAGHHAKITLNYRHRPDFTNIENLTYRPEVTLQAMIYL